MGKSAETYGSSRLILAAELALVLLIAYLCVRTVIVFVAPQSLWTEPSSTVVAAKQTQIRKTAFNPGFDPFNRSKEVEPVDMGLDAPETSLNLKLTGLRSGDNGSAVLQTPDNLQKAYSIGDEIISGVTLHSVTPHYIVLSLGGRLERLTFERAQKNTLLARPEGSSPNSIMGGSAAPKVMMAPENLLSAVRLEPVITDGQMKGFRIAARNGSINLTTYGLRDGDILTRIDRVDLTTGRPDIQKVMTLLDDTSGVDVSVLRGGRSITVKVGSQ